MTGFPWIKGVRGEVVADGKAPGGDRLWPAAGMGADDRHAARGARLRRAMARLSAEARGGDRLRASSPIRAQATAGSDPVDLPRPLDYMSREARLSLPAVLDAIGFERGILLGHSDGASIAAIYAGERSDERVKGLILMAPHLFTEEPGLASIAEARRAYETGDLRARLAKYHAHVDSRLSRLERRLARSRLQGLEHRGCGRPLARSRARHPGRRRSVRNARADPRNRDALARGA